MINILTNLLYFSMIGLAKFTLFHFRGTRRMKAAFILVSYTDE